MLARNTGAAFWLSTASVAISTCFLLYLPIRLYTLYNTSRKVYASWYGPGKLVLSCLIFVLQLLILITIIQDSREVEELVIISTVISDTIASLGVCCLTYVDHRRSIQPSDSISSYLLASGICDAVSLCLTRSNPRSLSSWHAHLATAQLLVKVVLLALESKGKESTLYAEYQNISPEETAGILRGSLFWWINTLLKTGSEAHLHEENLPALDSNLSSKILRDKVLREWGGKGRSQGKYILPFVLLRTLLVPCYAAILPRCALIIFRYAQPILIRQTIRFVSDYSSTADAELAGFWIIISALFVYVGLAFSTSLYQHRLGRLKVLIRGTLVNLIYHQLLERKDEPETDGAITLMSTDTDSVSNAGEMFHELWARIIEVVVGMSLLSMQAKVKWLWVVPLVLIFFCSRVSRYVAQNLKSRQKDWAAATQDRLVVTSCVLGSMKSVKALGLSDAVSSQIRDFRTHELDRASRIRWMNVAYNASANALGIFTPAITMVLYATILLVQRSEPLDAETAYTVVAILSLVTHPANMVMTIYPRIVACSASFERIQTYLEHPKRENKRNLTDQDVHRQVQDDSVVRIANTTVNSTGSFAPILKDINLDIRRGQVVICAGIVGSGKSVMAKVILGELQPELGTVIVNCASFGFCSQAAWLPNGTIREVIRGLAYREDDTRYQEAVKACCLTPDIESLSDGDETIIGSRGMNLSGGQRQRLALARVLCNNIDMAILDDPFSALDKHTEQQIVNKLFGKGGIFRKQKSTVLWITNNVNHFHLADFVVILGNTRIEHQGSWDALKLKKDIGIQELSKTGHSQGGPLVVESAKEIGKIQSQERLARDLAADADRKTGDLSLYGFYIKYAGPSNILLMLACTATYSVFITFPHYWLKWWTESGIEFASFYMTGYVIFSVIAWASTSSQLWAALIKVAAISGARLHDLLLRTIMAAPLSYFSSTGAGSILNKFSQDIQLVDIELPAAAQSLGAQVLKLITQIGVLLSVQKLMVFSIPLSLGVVYVIQHVYLRTSRQLRYIELESRSSVFSSFLETIEGLTTIRAFGWQEKMEDRNIVALDRSQKAMYILLCLQRWLNLVLDLMMAGVAVSTIYFAIIFRGTTSGASIGVAMNIIIVANTTLLRLVESWTNLEISLGAIARLKSLEQNTPSEIREDDLVPNKGWPKVGAIEFDKVTATYNGSILALNQVSFKAIGGQKVAICGRTGSGKSTMILSLLGMIEYSGNIKLDGIDLKKVCRNIIRERCFINIAQEAFLLPQSTLRFNLDPTQMASDEDLVHALKIVDLWKVLCSSIKQHSDAEILNQMIMSLPMLSAGQIQLLSLARAIIKRELLANGTEGMKPVLLLDEATSSLDPVTEKTVHEVIDAEFVRNGHTTILITHRPGMLAGRMKSGRDIFIFMRNGSIEEIRKAEEFFIQGQSLG